MNAEDWMMIGGGEGERDIMTHIRNKKESKKKQKRTKEWLWKKIHCTSLPLFATDTIFCVLLWHCRALSHLLHHRES